MALFKKRMKSLLHFHWLKVYESTYPKDSHAPHKMCLQYPPPIKIKRLKSGTMYPQSISPIQNKLRLLACIQSVSAQWCIPHIVPSDALYPHTPNLLNHIQKLYNLNLLQTCPLCSLESREPLPAICGDQADEPKHLRKYTALL